MEFSKIVLNDLNASPSLVKRLHDADIDKDGVLSLQEVIEIVRSEQRAQSDRRFFRNFLVALACAVLVLVAALVGAVFAIVKLTDDFNDNNGSLVSSRTGNMMVTGRGTNLVDLQQLYAGNSSRALAEQLEVVMVSKPDGSIAAHRVAGVRTMPMEQKAIIVGQDGTEIELSSSGLMYLKDPLGDSYNMSLVSAGRRLLLEDSLATSYGVRSQQNTCDYDPEKFLECTRHSCFGYSSPADRTFDLATQLGCLSEEPCIRLCYSMHC